MPDTPLYPNMSPSDAVVALRSLPRRFRSLFATPGEADEEERLAARRPAPSEWSAVEHVNHVCDLIDHTHRQLERVLVQPDPAVEQAPSRAPARTSLAGALDRLRSSTERLAARAERAEGSAWARRASTSTGETVTALDVLRRGVEQAVRTIREVERVLDRVRGRPDLDDVSPS